MKPSNIFIHFFLWAVALQVLFGLDAVVFDFIEAQERSEQIIDDILIFIPLVVTLFYINRLVLFPSFLKKESIWKYIGVLFITLLASVTIMIGIFILCESLGYTIGYGERFTVEDAVFTTVPLFLLAIGASTSISSIPIIFQNIKRRKQAEAKQKDAELRYLNAQFNPHFLHNTLNGIYSLCIEQNAIKAGEAVISLSELMRYPISNVNKTEISLIEEIAFLQQYINLEKLRLGEDYPIVFNTEGNLESVSIIPFCLITIVENAFKYGVSQAYKYKIAFQLSVNEKQLTFSSQNTIVKTNKSSHSFGLENLKERLNLYYQDKYSLQIHNSEKIFSLRLCIDL